MSVQPGPVSTGGRVWASDTRTLSLSLSLSPRPPPWSWAGRSAGRARQAELHGFGRRAASALRAGGPGRRRTLRPRWAACAARGTSPTRMPRLPGARCGPFRPRVCTVRLVRWPGTAWAARGSGQDGRGLNARCWTGPLSLTPSLSPLPPFPPLPHPPSLPPSLFLALPPALRRHQPQPRPRRQQAGPHSLRQQPSPPRRSGRATSAGRFGRAANRD